MIRFSLSCGREHIFEGWFAGNEDYEKQQRTGLIVCPVCGSTIVGKGLMAPHIAAPRAIAAGTERETGETLTEGAGSEAAARAEALQKLLILQKMQKRKLQVLHKLQQLAREMREKAENVGENFTEEARKIHYGEAEARPIYGKARADEVEALLEDGIDVLPLPALPEDAN